MDLEFKDGNYTAAENGGLRTVKGRDELIQRLMMRLSAHRGGFLPLPDFGSRLHTLGSVRPALRSAAARQFVHEALEGEKLLIEDVQCFSDAPDSLTVKVWLDISGNAEELTIML